MELLVVIAIIGILIGMLLPAVQSVRAAARRTSCANNMRQVSVAIHNYESALQRLPENQVGSGEMTASGQYGTGHYSWMVPLLPNLELSNVRDLFDLSINNGDGNDYRVSSDHPNAVAVNTLIETFLCPSDVPNRNNSQILGSANPAPSNYVANAGWPSYTTGIEGERSGDNPFNGVIPLRHPSREIAWHGASKLGFKSISDGMSNTAMLSERLIQSGNSMDAILSGDQRLQSQHVLQRNDPLPTIALEMASSHTHVPESAHLGRSWSSGAPRVAPTYMHVQSPNGVMGHYNSSLEEGDFVITPSSNHAGGVNMGMADGSMRFVSDTVDQKIWWAVGGRDDGRIETFN